MSAPREPVDRAPVGEQRAAAAVLQRRRFLWLLCSPLPLAACRAVAQAAGPSSGGDKTAISVSSFAAGPSITATPPRRVGVGTATSITSPAPPQPASAASAATHVANTVARAVPPRPAATTSPVPTAPERPTVRLAAVQDGDITVLDTASGSLTKLTGDGISSSPRWSADGRALFFAKQPYGKPAEAWRWQQGSELTQVQAGLWSPDGNAVAFSQPVAGAPAGTMAVWVERDGQRRQITPAEPNREWEALAWSPDSRRLALARYTTLGKGIGGRSTSRPPTLWLTDASFAPRSQLPLPNPNGQMNSWPDTLRWSPNGSWLLLGVGPGQGCSSCRADGLPFYALPASGGPALLLENALPDGAIAWSPDGAWTVFSGGAYVGRITYQKKRLTRFAGPSGQHSDLTSDPQWSDIAPAVSPDGRQIAFARGHSQRPGETTIAAITSRRLWLIATSGGEARQVTTTGGWTDEAPAWTPDGAWLVFVRWRPQSAAGPAAAGLWAVRPDGTQLQSLDVNIGSSHSGNTYTNGFGYYGSFGWDEQFAIAPKS